MDSEPTPDVQSAVEAGIAATREADKSIEATITARVEATKAAEPTPEPTPTLPPPTPTMQLDPTVAPTPTRIPQSMPIAVPASEEIRGFAGRLYDCIKENREFRQIYEQGAVIGGTAEGMTEEGVSELVEYRLSSKEFFVLAYTEGVTEDSSIEAQLRTILELCEGTASGQVQSGGPIDVLSGKLYDCMLRNDEFREIFRQAGTSSAAEEGLTHEAAIGLVDYLLNSRDFFILSARMTARDNPLFAADMEASLVECESSADAAQPSDTSLRDYADRHAGGPGAIYVGDLNQLAGPAVANEFLSAYGADLGDDYGDVPLDAIRDHRWIFESDYYQSLLEKAKLTNPTNLVSRGERITLKHACINRTLPWCKHMEAYFVPNVIARTNGQVRIETTSFPELGLAGFDTADLLREGTLGMSEVYGGYVGGQFPTLAVQNLWGLWPDHETHFAVQVSLAPEVNRVVAIEMDAQVLMRNWIAGDDQLLFSNHRLDSPGDFRGLKTRSHSTELSDWINGMGANAQAMAFAEVYTALERGILEAGVTGANAGLSQRWYEVINYINGPLYSFNSTINAINGDV